MEIATFAAILVYRISTRTHEKDKDSGAPGSAAPTAEFLLLHDSFAGAGKRHWAPPKRLVAAAAAGETEELIKRAASELAEMTGLQRNRDYSLAEPVWSMEIRYLSATSNRPKRVVIFLAKLNRGANKVLVPGEGIQFAWLPERAAMDRASFPSMQGVISQAANYIGGLTKPQMPSIASFGGGGERPSWRDRNQDAGSTNSSANPLFKTRLCERFKEGTCTFGDRCHFAHGVNELRKTTTRLPAAGEPDAFRSRSGPADGKAEGPSSFAKSIRGNGSGNGFPTREVRDKDPERIARMERGNWRAGPPSASS